jgi:hypothetical protein
MVRDTLSNEYPIYHSFIVNTMSVSYVQEAKYKYAEEKLSDKAFSKIAAKLSEKGLVLCSSSHWTSTPPSVSYGLVEEVDSRTRYLVTIDGKPAITVKWASDAKSWKEQLIENGFDCDYTTEKVETTKEVWAKPRGSSMYMHDSLAIKTDKSYTYLKLLYNDSVVMTPTLSNSSDGLTLSFTTRWETMKVARKAVIESTMVQAPLADLGLIQSIVEDALGISEPVDIDCNFRCETLATSECTPDIIAMRKQASIDARNATQEEE